MQMDSSKGLPMAHSVSPEAEAWELAAAMRMHWEVEFARFFNFPSSTPPAGLRPLPKSRTRSMGTWIPASSPAILLIHKTNRESAYILSVTVPALTSTIEEHYVPNLIFSWPQLPCISQFSVGGSRVIFASYMDSSNQVQKFALRFSSCSDAEAFVNFVKGIMGDVPPESDFACENSSASEIASLSTLRSCVEQPMPTDDGGISDLINNKQLEISYPFVLSSCARSISPGLPPSFAELLTNCLNRTGKEQTNPTSQPGNGSNAKEHLMNPYLQEQSNPTGELGFEFHAQEFLVNPLLQDVSKKLESVSESSELVLQKFMSDVEVTSEVVIQKFMSNAENSSEVAVYSSNKYMSDAAEMTDEVALQKYMPVAEIICDIANYISDVETTSEIVLQNYMSDATFIGILSQLDKIVDELGGDLALEVAGLSCDKCCRHYPGSS